MDHTRQLLTQCPLRATHCSRRRTLGAPGRSSPSCDLRSSGEETEDKLANCILGQAAVTARERKGKVGWERRPVPGQGGCDIGVRT